MPFSVEDRIASLFDARARDVTPAGVVGDTCVLYLPVLRDVGPVTDLRSILSAGEAERAGQFANRVDAELFIQRRAFRRYCAAKALGRRGIFSEMVFRRTSTGRPFLAEAPDLWFSFSSCPSGLLGAWSSTHVPGVDIEDRMPASCPADFAESCFSAAEARLVRAQSAPRGKDACLLLWCLKEAALKSVGQGLPFGVDAFTFELEPKLQVVTASESFGGPGRFSPFQIEGPRASAALVLHASGKAA